MAINSSGRVHPILIFSYQSSGYDVTLISQTSYLLSYYPNYHREERIPLISYIMKRWTGYSQLFFSYLWSIIYCLWCPYPTDKRDREEQEKVKEKNYRSLQNRIEVHQFDSRLIISIHSFPGDVYPYNYCEMKLSSAPQPLIIM